MRRLDRKKYLTRDEVARLLTIARGFTDAIGRQDYVFLTLALNSGLRIGELLRARPCDVTCEDCVDENGVFRLPAVDVWDGKGAISRRVYVNAIVFDLISRFIVGKVPDAPIFTHERLGECRCYTRRAFTYRLKRLLKLAALPPWYSLHSLRHTYATHYLEATKSLNALKEQLGHKSLETTQCYVATFKREFQKSLATLPPLLASPRGRAKHEEQ